ncbi:MAG TPA: HlyD family secretion protein [Candidatus Saccharimonadales bacterium]|jgi:membrane fusion protein (multidrug efflux system)|nr:HlyD family secretion protein [Candidatus Saccharimonadales bacterium]
MSNNDRTHTIGPDEQEVVSPVEHQPVGSQLNNGANKEMGKNSTTRRKKLLLLSAGIVIVIGAGYFAWDAFRYEDTDDAQVDGHVMQLSARISGQVAEVPVIEGQLVHAGDVLVTIDPQDYKIALEQAQANVADALATAASSHWTVPITSITVQSNLDSAKTAVTNAEAAVKAAEQNYESAKAALVQAEANAGKSDADLERAKQLVAKEDISRLQYDQAVATATVNRAAVLSAQAVVHAVEQSVQQAQGKLLQAKNDLQTAETAPEQISLSRSNALAADAKASQREAQLAQTELNLKYTVIRSPVTGIVGKRNVEVGQNVSVGQELVDVVPLDDVWVTANFKETQLEHMRAGQHVKIKVDAYGRTWYGHVTNMGGGTGSIFSLLPPENATGNYVKVVQRVPVRIDFDRAERQDFNAEGLLKPGLSVVPDVRVR